MRSTPLHRLRPFRQRAAAALLAMTLPCAPSWAQSAETRTSGSSSSLPTLGDPAQGSLTSAQEKRLGEIIMREMRQEPAYLEDSLELHLKKLLHDRDERVRVKAGRLLVLLSNYVRIDLSDSPAIGILEAALDSQDLYCRQTAYGMPASILRLPASTSAFSGTSTCTT